MELGTSNSTEFESVLLDIIANGTALESVSANDLIREQPRLNVIECADWLLSYKEKRGVISRCDAPTSILQLLESLNNISAELWPQIQDFVYVENSKAIKHVESTLTKNQSSLTDALLKISHLNHTNEQKSKQITGLLVDVDTYQKLIDSMTVAHEQTVIALEKNIELLIAKEKKVESDSKATTEKTSSKKTDAEKVKELRVQIKALDKRLIASEERNEQLVTQLGRLGEQLERSSERLFAASKSEEDAKVELARLNKQTSDKN